MLTTSQRIALRFACTIAGIILFLGIVINFAFFASWWKREQQQLLRAWAVVGEEDMLFKKLQRKFFQKKWGDFGPRNILFVDVDSDEHDQLRQQTFFANIARFDDEWYLYGFTYEGKRLVVIDISPVVANQLALLWITIWALILSSGVWYVVAVYQVKKGLRDLHTLAQKVQHIDVDSLQQSLTFDHLPEYDEINILSHALDDMTTKVHAQVTTIKQFVANVSHEFKTPLMSLQSILDVSEKTKNYESTFLHIREQIGVMNRLLDTLTFLTRVHKEVHIEKRSLVIVPVIRSLISVVQEKYPWVAVVVSWDDSITCMAHQWFVERIMSNLLDNAAKFTPTWWNVEVTISPASIEIIDTWSGISPEQLTHIRDPFWQGDAARWGEGFWLWLALVKQLVTLLARNIEVKSVLGAWTTVTIKLKNSA